MADGGWIKIYRKMRQSFVWTDANVLKLWMLILFKASHSGNKFLFNGREVSLNSGQLVTGRAALTSEMNEGVRSGQQVNSSFVWRTLKRFEESQMLNIDSNPQYSVITVLNWDAYQRDEQQVNNDRTTTEQQTNTIKNEKNAKNEKNSTTTGNLISLETYQKNFGSISPLIREKITDWIGDFQSIGSTQEQADKIIGQGMEIAVTRNKRSFGYVEAILRDWEGKGLNTVEAIDAENAQWAASHSHTSMGRKTPVYQDSSIIDDDDLPF